MSEWISVKDRLPEPLQIVLTFNINKKEPEETLVDVGYMQISEYGNGNVYWLLNITSYVDSYENGYGWIPNWETVYWMPLPSYPELFNND